MNEETKLKYNQWLYEPLLTEIERTELSSLKEEEINERFSSNLEFGTAGLRGIMGVGTNRMNKYIVRQATQGLAQYLKTNFKKPTIAIAYDSRNNSELFAKEAACVLAANDIQVFIYKQLMPVPTLSFAVRELKCSGGIVITASHNPKQYNGYKVYGSDGSQIKEEAADEILKNIANTNVFKDIKNSDFLEGLTNGKINYIDNKLIEKYYKSVLSQSIFSTKRNLKITYTPLNGSGLTPVCEVLSRDGFYCVDIVEEQKMPDGNFTTCPYPNPEMKETMVLGTKLMLENQNDILLATDPDADRVGVCVNNHGNPVILTGNEIGILLFDFIVKARQQENKMPNEPVVVKTIVSTGIIDLMAKKYNVKVVDVLTGFKYIGEQIQKLEEKGKEENFLLGFEESCGYLTNTEVRDKDGVNAVLLIAEMADYYKSMNLTLVDRLQQIYDEFGDYKTTTLSFEFPGIEGKTKISNLMETLRTKEIQKSIGKVNYFADYSLQKFIYKNNEEPTNLPKSNVLKLFLDDAETVTFRPSGTEPKIKAYIFAHGETRLAQLKNIINEIIK